MCKKNATGLPVVTFQCNRVKADSGGGAGHRELGEWGIVWIVGAGGLVRHYAVLMAHEYVSVPAADTDVIGILAYSSLAFMTRLAKDGEQAPTFEAHVEHARMAAQCFALYQQLEVWSEHRDFDLMEAAGAFTSAYDDLDARTRPTTFAERSVKTFITRGMLGEC